MFNNCMDMTVPVKNFIRENPVIFYPLCRVYFSRKVCNSLVQPDTQIVIEGFARSANSFAVTAFLQAQPYPVKIAHHFHAPAQIIRAVKWQIPTLVLLRNPKDAVLSCAAAFPSCYSIYQLLSYYLSFYSSIFEYRNSYVIGEFQEVTQNFGLVIERINRRFDTQFAVWENTPANQQEVRDAMGGQINTSFPHKHLNIKNSQEEEMRQKLIDDISSKKYAGMLEEANQIYQIFKQAAHDEREIVGAGS